MRIKRPPFELKSNELTIRVHPLAIPGFRAYQLEFSNVRRPLILAKAEDAGPNDSWRAVPEWRQMEADEIGKLIDDYLNTTENPHQ